MTPQQFITKWRDTSLGEKQSYQSHFNELCDMLGHAKPDASGIAENGQPFQFEWSLKKTSGGQGFADVYYGGHFAIEYKSPGKYKDLGGAYDQLLQYRENLNNPPLLVVTDIYNWEIHTNFPNSAKDVYRFKHEEIFAYQHVLIDMFFAPERLNPNRHTEKVTAEAADAFRLIADNMRQYGAEPERIAHFVTKLVFCLFAEDVRLLPPVGDTQIGIVTHTIQQARRNPSLFVKYMEDLFLAMADGGDFLLQDIHWFNGNLFEDVSVEPLYDEELIELEKAAKLDWEAIEPSIFGTLFERSLDPDKRSQLGAHYTSREDILLIVEPVLMQPLRYEWDTVQLEAEPVRQRFEAARTGRAKTNARNQLINLRDRILGRIRQTTVLDPACGSGNFLYVSLQMLMELEKEVINHHLWEGLQMPLPAVHPRQMYGIELNPIAHALASIVVWIGYIQWRKNNGYGQAFSEPILETLQGNIVCKDAILPPIPHPPAPSPKMKEGELGSGEHAKENESRSRHDLATGDEKLLPLDGEGVWDGGVNWPPVDVIVGNPPFLGGKKQRRELGDEYIERLFAHYPQIHGEADLSTYWFEKSRQQVNCGEAKRAGLLSTNSIRGVRSRPVLSRIKESGDIFMAWSDREWILEGAAVRVSMIGFDDGGESTKTLDGVEVNEINPDLTGTDYVSGALSLEGNRNISYMGLSPTGNFSIDDKLAQKMLAADNQNIEVLNRYISGTDITKRDRAKWIIDFTGFDLRQAEQYEMPLRHLLDQVKPYRDNHSNKKLQELWWQFEATRSGMISALGSVSRQLMTSLTAKHRFFVWYPSEARAANTVVTIARDDDYMFGMLHSKIHVAWALRKGATLEDRPRYNNSTTFETFPFPWSPGQEDESDPAHIRISAAAKQLHEERAAWLNPHPPAPSRPPVSTRRQMREGEQTRVKWDIPPDLERRMQAAARELCKNPTPAENTLWQAIRKKRLDGRKFRRQVAIGAFVVDFYCASERLAVEVDGPIHDAQGAADRIRQELVESLGIRFVRLTNEDVEHNLESSLDMIRSAFYPHPPAPSRPPVSTRRQMREGELSTGKPAKGDESPSLFMGEGFGVGEKALKDRTLTNLYNALHVFRGRDSMKTKEAAADFAPRLDQLHRTLDQAVCDAYGWEYDVLDDEEEILRRLLALNLERAAQSG